MMIDFASADERLCGLVRSARRCGNSNAAALELWRQMTAWQDSCHPQTLLQDLMHRREGTGEVSRRIVVFLPVPLLPPLLAILAPFAHAHKAECSNAKKSQ